jgi:hypothetical protein
MLRVYPEESELQRTSNPNVSPRAFPARGTDRWSRDNPSWGAADAGPRRSGVKSVLALVNLSASCGLENLGIEVALTVKSFSGLHVLEFLSRSCLSVSFRVHSGMDKSGALVGKANYCGPNP